MSLRRRRGAARRVASVRTMTDMEELRPVPRERAILESFFTQLGMFSFDRAKDYVEKERDSSKSAGAIWAALLAALAHLAAAEKLYHNMTFLGQKLGKSTHKKKHRKSKNNEEVSTDIILTEDTPI